jgi:hypothetical protein
MTNELTGHIARRLCRRAALENENHKNHYALRVLPCSATQRRTRCTRKPIRHGYTIPIEVLGVVWLKSDRSEKPLN